MNTDVGNDLATRLGFMDLDASNQRALADVGSLVERHIEPALDRFYSKIAQAPQADRHFSSQGQIERAKGMQGAHWRSIITGQLDEGYYARGKRIGQVHARIGLEPQWYMGGSALIVETILTGAIEDYLRTSRENGGLFRGSRKGGEALSDSAFAQGIAALVKAIILDMEIAVSTYFENICAEAIRLNEDMAGLIGAAKRGDFSARMAVDYTNAALCELSQGANELMTDLSNGLDETRSVLGRLAETDLSLRVEGDYEGTFKDLKDDTNAVAERLSEIVRQLQTTSRSLRSATGEILAGANDLAERTTRQAAAVEETTAAMDQLAGTVDENAQRAGLANEGAEKVSRLAAEAGTVMSKANAGMESMAEASNRISGIIGMIDNIAFQTNLLALNASVEAARAGEAGKGFAVVAIEVRRLAQSAAQASAEVKALIEQSGEQVATGAQLVADAAGKVESMLAGIKDNARHIEAIAGATRQQSQAIAEVASAVRLLDEMTQHNAALVEETNAAIEQTEAQAGELDMIVDVFTLDDGDDAPIDISGKGGVVVLAC